VVADNLQASFVTTPVTNNHFKSRVFELVSQHLQTLKDANEKPTSDATASRADPIIPPLTPEDTGLFPSPAVNTYVAYISPWIDLSSKNPVVASISRQVLNLEINYANFCGVKSIIVPGPRHDATKAHGNQGIAQYSRAIQEALSIGNRLTFLIHMPMYREPSTQEPGQTLSSLDTSATSGTTEEEIDIFTTWDSWHHIRTVCNYNLRLYVGMWPISISPSKLQCQDCF
jgi:type II protein arginine methyltransferase